MDPRLIPPLARSAPRPSMQAALDQMGPKESPGLVSWHKHMGEAGAASARSGKPILLVHVLGNLDDHFC